MAKLLPLRRGALRALATTILVAVALLLQSLAFLGVDARPAKAHGLSALSPFEAAICRAITLGDDPSPARPAQRHGCDLCPIGGCDREAASHATLASHAAFAAAPRYRSTLAALTRARATPRPAGCAHPFSPRAPPLA